MSAINKELQKRLDALEQEQNRQEVEVKTLTTAIKPVREPAKDKAPRQNGFVIRLDFGAGAPVSEWSDDTHGWRSHDLGTRYNTEELAEKKLAELKQKWPDYPLKTCFTGPVPAA